MRSKWVMGLGLAVCLMFGAVAFAQDATPEATAGPLTIGDVTGGNAANYYGQEVTLDGNVDELVNVRSFLLGGGGLNNPQVLVLNNSGQEFNIGLTKDAKVRVTGTVYPSYNLGGWDQVSAIANTSAGMTGMDTTGAMATESAMATEDTTGMMTTESAMATEGAMATESAMPTESAVTGMDTTLSGAETTGMSSVGGWVGLDQFPLSILTNRFPDHTLFVINSVDAVEYLPNPDAGVTATPAPAG